MLHVLRTLLLQAEGSDWMEDLWKESSDLESVDAAMAVDIKSYLPYDLLTKVDIASMANSLEARSPFLDHVVMEFAAQLPGHFKLRGRQSKYLLKKTFADLASDGERKTRARWVSECRLPNGCEPARVSCSRIHCYRIGPSERGYFKPDRVDYLVREHVAARADHSFQLWNLLMLELWQQEFVDACVTRRQ